MQEQARSREANAVSIAQQFELAARKAISSCMRNLVQPSASSSQATQTLSGSSSSADGLALTGTVQAAAETTRVVAARLQQLKRDWHSALRIVLAERERGQNPSGDLPVQVDPTLDRIRGVLNRVHEVPDAAFPTHTYNHSAALLNAISTAFATDCASITAAPI